MTAPVLEKAVELAPRHPALRWTPEADASTETHEQHRRADTGAATVCGLAGPLILADTQAPYCPDCFPPDR